MSLLPVTVAQAGQTLSDVKSQPIRLADIFFVGPMMLTGGILLTKKGNPFFGGVLGILGATTIAYNARNYEIIERRLTIRL